MPANNPSTPPGWQRMRCHGGLMFVRKGEPLVVRKKDGSWRIWDLAGDWVAREKPHPTWIDAVRDVDESLELRKEAVHG